MAQAQASGLLAYGAGGFDPMSAWYAYHLGQQALAKGAPPSAAAFSNCLAGAHPDYTAARWQKLGRPCLQVIACCLAFPNPQIELCLQCGQLPAVCARQETSRVVQCSQIRCGCQHLRAVACADVPRSSCLFVKFLDVGGMGALQACCMWHVLIRDA